MKKNENVNKRLEAGAQTNRHSEGIRPKNPLHILKRFFAKYNFPFTGNYIKPAQNDSNFLVPQCLSNLVPFNPLSLPSPSVLRRSHKTGTAIAFHPLLACAWGEGSKNVMDLSSYRLIDFPTLKKKAAFTLAEVLITLGIIGVVAALTIPGLITKYHRSVVENKLKKFYSTMNQAVRLSIEDNDGIPPVDMTDVKDNLNQEKLENWYKNYILKYMQGVSYSLEVADDGGDGRPAGSIKVLLNDGSGFYSYIQSNKNLWLFYCINALDKSCKFNYFDGKNSFLFKYNSENSIFETATEHYSYDKSKNYCYGEGIGWNKSSGCASVIKNNGWKIPDDYPRIK